MEKIIEQIKCIEREIGMRERVYPRWVESKKMTQQKADEEIKTMREVLKTLNLVKDLYFGLCKESWTPNVERIYDVDIKTIEDLRFIARKEGFTDANEFIKAFKGGLYRWK